MDLANLGDVNYLEDEEWNEDEELFEKLGIDKREIEAI